MAQVTTDMPSSRQQQHSSDNNNGNDRSLALTGVGAQENFIPITALLEMWASRLGVLVCGCVVLALVQGGIIPTVETKDRVFITVLFFLVCFRCWRYFYPQDTGSLTKATQSLSADNTQQLALPIGSIKRLFYWWNLVSAIICFVLSLMRLVSQDFGQTDEVAKKVARDFNLNVFYCLTLVEALGLLFALMFEWAKHSQPAPPTLSQPASPTLFQPTLELEAQMGRTTLELEAPTGRAQMRPQMGRPTLELEAQMRPPMARAEMGEAQMEMAPTWRPLRGEAQSQMGRPTLELEAQMERAPTWRPLRARAEMGEAQMDRTQMGEAQMPEKVIPRRRRRSARRLEHGDPEGGATVPKDL